MPCSADSRAHFLCLALRLGGFVLATPISLAAVTEDAVRAFDVPAGEAIDTLRRAAQQGGVEIVFLVDIVRGVRTAAVRGQFTPREALDRLVHNTGLVVARDARTGTLTVNRAPAPSVPSPKQNSQTSMNPTSASRPAGWISALLAFVAAPFSAAQTAPATPTDVTDQQAITLAAFEVNTDRDVGYVAANALVGGRTDAPLKLTPSAVSAMTTEFIEDLAIGDLREALQWTLNVEPDNAEVNASAQGSHLTNFRGTSGAGNYPSRNYFLHYGIGESYNTERFEFARGPNAVLFGEAQLGGVATTFTKIPRLRQNFYRASTRYTYPSTGDGRWRGTVDVNRTLGGRVALRLNVLGEDGPSWRNYSDQTHKAATLAGLVKLTDRTQFRAEGEKGEKSYNLYASNYGDGVSYWNGTYLYNGANPVTGAAATAAGVSRLTAVRNIWIPAVPQAGLGNWINTYRTSGTGLSLLPDARPFVPNFPVLPSAEFTLAPTDAYSNQRYKTLSAFLDHRFSDSLQAQLASYYYSLNNFVRNNVTLGGYNIDLNQFLPNGLPNPKVGVPFSEVRPSFLNPRNKVTELRAMVTYKLDVPKAFDLRQRFTFIGGRRFEHFQTSNRNLQQVAGPGQNANFNHASMQVFYRYYWDEPLQYGMSDFPADPSREFAFLPGNIVNTRKTIDYAQISSLSTFFNERVSLVLGVRRDFLDQRRQGPVANINVNNNVPQLGFSGVVGDWEVIESQATSPSVGGVVFVTPWLGVFGNFSKNFSPPSNGAGDVNGNSMEGPRGQGYDYGFKINLLNGQVYATISRYESRQTDRIINIQAEINRLRANWTNIRSGNPNQTSVDFRDNETIDASGYEAEIVANPARGLRLSAGIAFPETKIVERLNGLRGYFDASLPAWEAALAAGAVDDANALNNNIAATRQTLESSTEGTRLDRTADYRWNFYTSYTLNEGKWKGLSFGGGLNGRGRIKIGTLDPRVLFNTTTPTNEQQRAAGFAEVKAPATYTVAARVGYRFRLAGVRTNVQLNINNLLNNDDPEWRSSSTYTPPGGILTQELDTFLRPTPRTFILTTSFEF